MDYDVSILCKYKDRVKLVDDYVFDDDIPVYFNAADFEPPKRGWDVINEKYDAVIPI